MKIYDLNIEKQEVSVEVNGETFNMIEYLPIERKIGITQLIQELCATLLFVDNILIDTFLHALMILEYTDIEFENNDELYTIDGLSKIYDYCYSTGILTAFINHLPDEEYNKIIDAVEDLVEEIKQHKNSSKAGFESLLSGIPTLVEELKEVIDGIDVDSLKVLKDIYALK